MRTLLLLTFALAACGGDTGIDPMPPDEVEVRARAWLDRFERAATDADVIALGTEFLTTVEPVHRAQLATVDPSLASIAVAKSVGQRLGERGDFTEAVRLYEQVAAERPEIAGEARYCAALQRRGIVDTAGVIGGDPAERGALRAELAELTQRAASDDPYRAHLTYKVGYLAYLDGDHREFVARVAPLVDGAAPGGAALLSTYDEMTEMVLYMLVRSHVELGEPSTARARLEVLRRDHADSRYTAAAAAAVEEI
jgi:hypothetical protein